MKDEQLIPIPSSLAESAVDAFASVGMHDQLDALNAILEQPAKQHQGESVVTWRDMATAPRDGTLVRLLVRFTEHSTEDEDEAPTIGANYFDNTEVDEWLFAGWSWEQDCFTQGAGKPVGWLPMLDTSHDDPGEVVRFGIQVEKLLCEALGREWSATGISIETLVADLKAKADPGEVERLSRKAANADLALAAQTRQVHALRAQLDERDALLRKVRAYVVSQERITAEIDAALSVGAEPAPRE